MVLAVSLPFPQIVLFDWDNTLVDTFPLLWAASTAARTGLGLEPWTEAEARQNLRLAAKESFPRFYGARADEAMALYYAHVRAHHIAAVQIIPQAPELLAWLVSRGVRLGIVSNKRSALLRAELAHLGWQHWLPVAVGADDVAAGKPDPEGLRLALQQIPGASGVSGTHIWYVGDTETDMQAAAKAGLCKIYVENDRMAEPEAIAATAPHASFKNLGMCLDYLDALAYQRGSQTRPL